VGETLRHALNSLAVGAPDWLRAQVPPEWFDRYGPRIEHDRLRNTTAAREALAATIGAAGRRRRQAVDAATALPWRRAVHERAAAAEWIASPYDPAARSCTTREGPWVGDTVHLPATGDEGSPHLITQAMTTSATTPDGVMGPTIPHDVAQRALLPGRHWLDGGDGDADLRVTAQTRPQSDGVGPPCGSYRRQRLAGQGDDVAAFAIAGEATPARCTHGPTRVNWTPGRDVSGDPVVRLRGATATCRVCPARRACTWAQDAPRQRTVRPPVHHEAIQAARQRQETTAFNAQYAQRAGVEGPQAQAIRRCGLRRSRYCRLAKPPLQHMIIAVALNVVRLGE
jgi:transposase